MRQAHIIVTDGKGASRLIGPGPADKIRAEAAKLDSGTLYIDGRNPRKIGFKSADAYLAKVAEENERMNAAAADKAKAKPAAEKAKGAPKAKKNPETERIKKLHNERIAKRPADFKPEPESDPETTTKEPGAPGPDDPQAPPGN